MDLWRQIDLSSSLGFSRTETLVWLVWFAMKKVAGGILALKTVHLRWLYVWFFVLKCYLSGLCQNVRLRKMKWNTTSVKSVGRDSKGHICSLIRFDWSGLSNHLIGQKHCRCSLLEINDTHTHAHTLPREPSRVSKSPSLSLCPTVRISICSGNCWQLWCADFTERKDEESTQVNNEPI